MACFCSGIQWLISGKHYLFFILFFVLFFFLLGVGEHSNAVLYSEIVYLLPSFGNLNGNVLFGYIQSRCCTFLLSIIIAQTRDLKIKYTISKGLTDIWLGVICKDLKEVCVTRTLQLLPFGFLLRGFPLDFISSDLHSLYFYGF